MIGTIPVDDLILLARRSYEPNDARRASQNAAARLFVGQVAGLLMSRFGNEVADEFVGSIGFDHLKSTANLAGNS